MAFFCLAKNSHFIDRSRLDSSHMYNAEADQYTYSMSIVHVSERIHICIVDSV